MKKLTCEMCGSTELLKQDGVFACQNCGTKYSVEEAKKMMIEGTVEVVGTVKIDNKNNMENWMQNARNAKQRADWDDTEKYYSLIKDNEPNNIEAIFYSAYGIARKSLSNLDMLNRERAFQTLTNSVKAIKSNIIDSNNADFLIFLSKDIKDMILGDFIFNVDRNDYGIPVNSDKPKTISLFNELNIEFVKLSVDFANRYNNISIHKMIIEHCQILIATKSLTPDKQIIWKRQIDETYKKIKELDSNYKLPIPPKVTTATDVGSTIGAVISIALIIGIIVFIISLWSM